MTEASRVTSVRLPNGIVQVQIPDDLQRDDPVVIRARELLVERASPEVLEHFDSAVAKRWPLKSSNKAAQPDLLDPHPLIDEEVVTNATLPTPPGGPFKAVPRPTVREFLRLCAERVRAYWIGGKSV